MRKIFNISIFYLILGLMGGVFYREFTKFNDFTGTTALKSVHFHVLVLGFFFFLILILFENQFKITTHKLFNKFFIFYNLGLLLSTIMFIVKGIMQVLDISYNVHMIAGLSGLGHILLGVGFVLFIILLRKQIFINEKSIA